MKKHEEFLQIFSSFCTGIDRCKAYELAENEYKKRHGIRKYKSWESCRTSQYKIRKKSLHNRFLSNGPSK